MGLLAGTLLELDLPRPDKRLFVIVEINGCFADGVSVATGCWLGRRTLRQVDYGRVAATIVDTATRRAIRLRPRSDVRTRALAWAPRGLDRWHAQLAGYQAMPDSELLEAHSVRLSEDLSDLVGGPAARVDCTRCGEEILNGRVLRGGSGSICSACGAGAYYVPHGLESLVL